MRLRPRFFVFCFVLLSFVYLWMPNCSGTIWNACLSSTEFLLQFCQKPVRPICVSLFLGALFHWCMYLSLGQWSPVLIITAILEVLNWGSLIAPTLTFLFRNYLSYSVLLPFHTSFIIILQISISTKLKIDFTYQYLQKILLAFGRDCVKPAYQLEELPFLICWVFQFMNTTCTSICLDLWFLSSA